MNCAREVFLFVGVYVPRRKLANVCMCVWCVISRTILKKICQLSAFNRTSEISERGRRRSRLTQVPQPRTHTTPVARWNIARTPLHFDIPGPEAPTKANFSLSLGIETVEEGQRESSRFIASHREEARPMHNCLCSCPALSNASDTFVYIPITYTYTVVDKYTPYVLRGDGDVGERTSRARLHCVPYPLPPQPHAALSSPCSTSLFLRSG